MKFCAFSRFLNLKFFGNFWGNSYLPCLLLIITLRFTSSETKILIKHQKVSKYPDYDCLPKFTLLFIFLLTAPTVESSHVLTEVYLFALKIWLRPNLKGFQ